MTRRSSNKQFFERGGRAVDLPFWDIDVPVYPAFDIPGSFPAGTAPVFRGPLAVVPAQWRSVGYVCCSGFIHVPAAAPVAGHHSWIVDSGDERNSAGIGSTGSFCHFVGDHQQLSLPARPLACLSAAFLLLLSLAVKPQIGGLIALYFVAQKIYWRYAAVALAGALALLALRESDALSLHPLSADWTSTLRANLSATLSPGGSADPRPANQEAVGDTNLQVLTSIFSRGRA